MRLTLSMILVAALLAGCSSVGNRKLSALDADGIDRNARPLLVLPKDLSKLPPPQAR